MRRNLLLSIVSVFITLVIVAFIGEFIIVGGVSLNQKLITKAWFLKNGLLGPAKIGIFQPDPNLGWKHKPNSIGKDFVPYVYKVKYTIDEKGNRMTPNDYKMPKLVMLGCSFTFGHGVEDDETYPAVLANQFKYHKIINAATNGWGSIQAWQVLKEYLNSGDSISGVFYGFIGHHQQRNYLRKAWLTTLNEYGRQNPRIDLVGDEIVFQGLSDMESDGIEENEVLIRKEKEITINLITEMQSICEKNNVPFYLVYLPDGYLLDMSEDISEIVDKGHFLDLRESINYDSIKNSIDGHPTARGHELIAHALQPVCLRLLN